MLFVKAKRKKIGVNSSFSKKLKNKMKKRTKIFFGIGVITMAIFAGYYFRFDLSGWFNLAKEGLEVRMDELKEIKQQIITPSPLFGPREEVASNLTLEGVVFETNIQRQQYGLPVLSVNAKLALMAQAKAEDMFSRQYFAHQSPTGDGPAELAQMVGYEYFLVGENLALGNYKDDEGLVNAWMNSPGHRENILQSKYTEIGVAVKRGVYEGKMVWLSVQEFGRPQADCPLPDEVLGSEIKEGQATLAILEQQLLNKKNEVENIRPKRGNNYKQAVDEYNELVSQYNMFANNLKALILDYNHQVKVYNVCIESM